MTQITVPNMKNTRVLINGVALSDVKLVKTYDDSEYRPIKELLSGEVKYHPQSANYRVLLVFSGETQLSVSSDFTLTIKTPEYVKTYSGCRVVSVDEIIKAPNIYEQEYLIKAPKKNQV